MIYFDSSAVVTAILARPHVTALREFVEASDGRRSWMSTVGIIEVVRVCDEFGDFPDLLGSLAADYDEIHVTRAVRDRAARLPGRLRALDAIHVASAELLGSDLVAVVTYDRRMADAARAAGLPVAMPGAE